MKKQGRIIAAILLLVLLCVLGAALVMIAGNSVSYKSESLMIPSGERVLQAQLLRPEAGNGLKGVVILVHGDGPADAMAKGFYISLCDLLAQRGYAVISWDKPGVNGSAGNWLTQTMNDRAREVIDVVHWVRERGALAAIPIGLWGASQAGWVMPKIPEKVKIDFMIFQSPAVNWIRQGLYHTAQSRERAGMAESKIAEAVEEYENEVELIRNSSYRRYREEGASENPMSEERFYFIKKNIDSDAREDLKKIDIPVLLALGGKDSHINPFETRAVYEEILPPGLLEVAWIENANHYLVRENLADKDGALFWRLVFWPKEILAPEYRDSLHDFLAGLDR